MKIEYLNNKLQNMKEIEKKYNELMGDKKTQSSTDKNTSYMIRNVSNSTKGRPITGHSIYISKYQGNSNSKNSSFLISRNNSNNSSQKELIKRVEIQDMELNVLRANLKSNRNEKTSWLNYKKRPLNINSPLPLKIIGIDKNQKNNENPNQNEPEPRERTITEYKEDNENKYRKNKTRNNENIRNNSIDVNVSNRNKKNGIIELDTRKNSEIRKEKSSDKDNNKRIKIDNYIFKGRNFFKNEDNKNKRIQYQNENDDKEKDKMQTIIQGKEKEEIKESNNEVKECTTERKQNYNHKHKLSNGVIKEINNGKVYELTEVIENTENIKNNKNVS